MHQPDIDGERPLTVKKSSRLDVLSALFQSTEVTLKPYDSAVK